MTNTEFILREKSGVNHISLTPAFRAQETHFGVMDGALILGFMAAFISLVLLLAR